MTNTNITFDKSTIPNLTGRVILITGGTGGIGAELVVELVKHNPGRIFFTGRNAKSAESTIQRAQVAAPNAPVSFIQCDLASMASVNEAARKILAETDRLDVFLANAGIMAKPEGLSADGYEIQFATNHLGHALLTKKLLPLLERTADLPGADVRVIITTSTAWGGGSLPFDRFKTTIKGHLGRWMRYSHSKLANLLYARELARRYPKVLSFSLTPGVVSTSLVSDLGLLDKGIVYVSQLGQVLTPEQGTFNHLFAISAPRDSLKPGAFYEPVGKLSKMETARSKDPDLPGQLWDWTEKELEKWIE
ncbi:oxidoreductase [Hypoxylon trugodes]|uniref:oxidoreductase n=1 Tax=Hypoxylon trugodes TaxID=326681 RepID=UPI002190CE87|nr:oxidoreductase [Hypoxylon trugodes]KAI1389136.1 oxidoreductase [Hypoxylon trugodes]